MSQHIINVAFDFDDDKVRRVLEETAERQVIDAIKKDIKAVISAKPAYYNIDKSSFEAGLKELVIRQIDTLLEDYKPEIIDAAAEKLAEKLSRTKAAKNIVVEQVLQQGLATAT